MPRKAHFICAFLTLLPNSFASIHVFDNFQDGDFTNNPTWFGTASYYSITFDPVFPENLVLQGTGGSGQHIPLEPTLPSQIPWQNYYFSVDVMATVSDFNPILAVRNQIADKGFIWHQFANQACIGDGPGGSSGLCCPGTTSCLVMSTAAQSESFQWYRIEWWDNPEPSGGPIQIRFSNLTQSLILYESGYTYQDPLGTSGIQQVAIYTERETPYYYDNLVLATRDADCNKNGIPDDVELVRDGKPDCNNNGVPDECDITNAWQITKIALSNSQTVQNPSLAISLSGQPAIAFGRGTIGQLALSIFDESWDEQVVDLGSECGGLYSKPFAAYGPDGDLSIACKCYAGDDLWLTSLIDDSWQPTLVTNNGDVGNNPRLTFLPNGEPALSSYLYGGTVSGELIYSWRENSVWYSTTVDNMLQPGVYGNTIAILPNGHPVIAYNEFQTGDVFFAEWDGFTWQRSLIEHSPGGSCCASMITLPSGYPAIAYELLYAGSGDVRYAELTPTGWQISTIDEGGAGNYPLSLALHNDGQPAVMYKRPNYEIVYRRFNGSSWSESVIAPALPDDPGGTLAVLPDDRPAIAFRDLDGDIAYATLLAFSIDCNANGVPDECDIINSDCNANSIPDDCESQCFEDAGCNDFSACTCDRCACGVCINQPIMYGDTNCDCIASDIDDILCVLSGFASYGACPSADIHPPCSGEGVINLDDILGVLAAFAGTNPCFQQCNIPCPVGACCEGSTCSIETLVGCATDGHAYKGDGTACPPLEPNACP